jgi:elongation factor P
MISTKDFRTGLKIEIDGKPFEIIEFQHFKPGKGGAMVRTKLRQMMTGQVLDKTFRSGEKVDKPDMAVTEMQYIFREGDFFVFMDLETYEQMHVPGDNVGEKGGFIKEGVTLKVAQTDPGIQGDRVSNATKPATMETGLKVNVPLFINEGDTIKVDTRSGEYLGRE